MPYTTFPNETVLLKVGREILVEVDTTLQSTRKRVVVAVSGNGIYTDYPLLTTTGVLWDFPERYTKRFRIRASKLIYRRANTEGAF